ncbi:MAG: hypothetical protein IPI39_25100 [Candidatus Obscuribacter sp.]|nr:hypothetical protein [Candidatus Obscuribacter sp.]
MGLLHPNATATRRRTSPSGSLHQRDGRHLVLHHTGHLLPQNGCQFDGQLDYIVARYLPEGEVEAMEGTFVTPLEADEIKAELLKRGFVDDKEFAEFMGSAGG